jgi:hypothetical protein
MDGHEPEELAIENQWNHRRPDDCWLLRVLKQELKDHELDQHRLIDVYLNRVSDEWIRVQTE